MKLESTRIKRVVEIFSKYKFDRILDIGCGDGTISMMLADVSNASSIYGIDIAEENVKSALKKGIKVFKLDVTKEKIPFEDDFFDAVFLGETIEHLYDSDYLLDEVYRTLKWGGYL
jgi:methionine biosynthesis protein MetW